MHEESFYQELLINHPLVNHENLFKYKNVDENMRNLQGVKSHVVARILMSEIEFHHICCLLVNKYNLLSSTGCF